MKDGAGEAEDGRKERNREEKNEEIDRITSLRRCERTGLGVQSGPGAAILLHEIIKNG